MRLNIVGAGAGVLIAHIKPAIFFTDCVRSKDSNLHTLRLGQGSVFADFCQALANGRVVGVVNIDVGSWARIRCLNILIAVTFLLLVEGDLNGLFLE